MKLFALLASAIGLITAGCDSTGGSKPPAHAATVPLKDAIVIDVRTPGEFAAGHIPGAINVPVDVIGERIGQVAPDKSKPLIVHCQSGRRSKIAAELLEAKGYRVQDLGSFANAQSVLK